MHDGIAHHASERKLKDDRNLASVNDYDVLLL